MSEEIDEMKVANFNAMTDNVDRLTAIRLLQSHDWDEMVSWERLILQEAVNEYMLNNAVDSNPEPTFHVPVQPSGFPDWEGAFNPYGGANPNPPQPYVPVPVPQYEDYSSFDQP